MMKKTWFVLFVILGLYALLCIVSSWFSQSVLYGFALPVMGALHRLTAGAALPVAEVLGMALAGTGILTLVGAIVRAVAGDGGKALRRWARGGAWAALALGGALALLWVPAAARPADGPPAPEDGELAWLCGQLVDALNAAPLDFPPPTESLRLAPEAANLPGRVVKAARYPEWMRLCRCSGLFVPLTGEALADATAPAALVPFTAVHELMHLAGIADEGAANIAAWDRCAAAGGAFADSARLWALRYALGMLRERDNAAWQAVRNSMKDPLAQVFREIGGEIMPADGTAAWDHYAALADYLAVK